MTTYICIYIGSTTVANKLSYLNNVSFVVLKRIKLDGESEFFKNINLISKLAIDVLKRVINCMLLT